MAASDTFRCLLKSYLGFLVPGSRGRGKGGGVPQEIVELLLQLQATHDLAYLFISHDLKVVRALASELVVMKEGLVVEQGPTQEIFAEPKEDYTKALIAAAFDIDPLTEP